MQLYNIFYTFVYLLSKMKIFLNFKLNIMNGTITDIQKVAVRKSGGLTVTYHWESDDGKYAKDITEECPMSPKQEVREALSKLALHLCAMWGFINAKALLKSESTLSAIELNKLNKARSEVEVVSVGIKDALDSKAVILGGKRQMFTKGYVACNSPLVMEESDTYPAVVQLFEAVEKLQWAVRDYLNGNYDLQGELFDQEVPSASGGAD